MHETGTENYHIPIDSIVYNLGHVPATRQLAPGVQPGRMIFLENLHASETEAIASQYASPTLTHSPEPATELLDFQREANMYLASLSEPDYTATETLCNQLYPYSKIPPMTVCIPAASHEEGLNLYHSLQLYAGQTRPPEDFEVVVFLNRPAFRSDGKPTDDTETKQALMAFQRDYRDAFQLQVMDTVFDTPPSMGEFRKLFLDACIMRHLLANTRDPIIVMNDVDIATMPRDYLEAHAGYFMGSPLTDIVIGEFDYDHKDYLISPFVHVAHRLHTIIATLKGNNLNPITNTNNSAVRGSAYCALGGNPKMKRSSDSYMGIMLHQLRGDHTTILRPEDDQRLVTQVSARRVLAAWQQGLAPNEKWRLSLGANNPEVRKQFTIESAINFDNAATFDEVLEHILTRLIGNYEAEGDDPRGWNNDLYHRAFALLGLEYSVTQGNYNESKLRLGNTALLREALKIFRHNEPSTLNFLPKQN